MELKPEEESTSDKSVKSDMPKCLKEELEPKESNEGQSSLTEIEEQDFKYCDPSLPKNDTGTCRKKRAYEQLSADSKLAMDGTKKLITSPAKKGKLKIAGDSKQPTLLSYYGKS